MAGLVEGELGRKGQGAAEYHLSRAAAAVDSLIRLSEREALAGDEVP